MHKFLLVLSLSAKMLVRSIRYLLCLRAVTASTPALYFIRLQVGVELPHVLSQQHLPGAGKCNPHAPSG